MGEQHMRKWLAAALIVAGSLAAWQANAEAQFKLRASLDTSATHARTIAVADYLKQVEARSGGRIATELFHSGQLFRDRDVAKALRQGAVEMAVPGNWVLTGIVPDADVFELPAFFGQPSQVVFKEADGPLGAMIDGELEKRLGVKILGTWLPLGYDNTYSTTKPINGFADMVGMKIRNSGGAGQAARARFFQAQPNMTAWPDVPLALSQGTFDAVSSTDESLASAQLWDSGIHYGFADKEFIGFYVPMVSDSFYNKLPPDLQKLLVDVWQENIGSYRTHMEAAQTQARQTLEQHGIKFVLPSDQALAQERTKMLAEQDSVAKEMRISPEALKQVNDDFKGNGS